RRPNGGGGGYAEPESFELDFEPSPSQATRQMSPEIAEALAARRDDEHEGPMIVDRPHWSARDDARRIGDQLDDQLDDIELGDDIDRHVARELGRDPVDDDLPFDPDEARAFDAA